MNGRASSGPGDSCHSRLFRNQQNLYPKAPTVVAKLLQYSGSRVELRDGFSSYKMICSDSKWCFLFGFQDFVKTMGVFMVKTGNKLK